MEIIRNYQYRIKYHSGKANLVTDALSKISVEYAIESLEIDSLFSGMIRLLLEGFYEEEDIMTMQEVRVMD